MFCRNCAEPLADSDIVCPSCGFAVGTGFKYCGQCGTPTEPGAVMCELCGNPVSGSPLGSQQQAFRQQPYQQQAYQQQPYADPYQQQAFQQQPYGQMPQQYADPYQQLQAEQDAYQQQLNQSRGYSYSQRRILSQNGTYVSSSAKSRTVAGILAIFLGWLGVHNFYLGYTGKGVVQLLLTLCSCGMGGVVAWLWGIIEGILLLSGNITTDGTGGTLKN